MPPEGGDLNFDHRPDLITFAGTERRLVLPGHSAENGQEVAGVDHYLAVRAPVPDIDQSWFRQRQVTEVRGDLLTIADRAQGCLFQDLLELARGIGQGLVTGHMGG